MIFPVTHDFVTEDTTKAQALKVLEESAEFFEAAKTDPDGEHTLEEAMDVLQALGNYCEKVFTTQQLHDGYNKVFLKNWNRGYYEPHQGGGYYINAEAAYKELTVCQ